MTAEEYLKSLDVHNQFWGLADEYEYTEKQLLKFAEDYSNEQLRLHGVSTRLLRELRKHYLVEIDFDSGLPKADMKTIMDLWGEVNKELQIITIDS